ncbi:hypothetical protein Tco_1287969 [Tanacetum coccineum]
MSNTNTNLQTQTSSVLQNDTVSSCSISNIQEKTQLSRSRCMHSLKEIKSLFKFLSETLQDYGTMPIFKRTFSQDLDLLEQHLTKDILSRTDCTTTLTNLRTKFENAFNSEFEEPGSRDRPPMLATGRYAQWRSRFLRYIDTKTNGDSLRKYILEGPYTPTTVIILVIPVTDNSPEVLEQTIVETVLNMSPANKAHFESEKKMIHLILTGIGDQIYSTVDACKIAHQMWVAIKRLQQGESLNIQDVKINLFWEFGKFTFHDGETIESYYIRFYKLVNEMIRNNLTVDKMQVNVQFL